jgi:flagellar protein FliO/FliZ
MKFRIVLAAPAWIWMSDAAFAQAVAQPALAPVSPMASMLQGLVGLVIVIGVIFAAAWLLKRVGPRARSSGIVRVVGGASVGPREKVVVVRFGHQTLLLGVAQGHVSLLHAADTIDAEPDDATASPAPRFIDRLRAARSNG